MLEKNLLTETQIHLLEKWPRLLDDGRKSEREWKKSLKQIVIEDDDERE
jgi:hypothetical protein